MTNPTTISAPPGTPFLDVEREFDAAPEQVFRAFTDPELVVRWLGPRRYEMVLDRWEPVSGGSYRYRHIADGDEHAFRGSFHTVEAGVRIIQTFEYEGMPNDVAVESMTFTTVDGRTLLRSRSVFPSVEALEGAMSGGMQDGMLESYERLDEVLAR